MSRPTRNVSETKRGRAETLAALKEAKAGGKKRSEQFNASEKDKIYDEIDESDYKKHRAAEDFVVDEEGFAVNYGEDEEDEEEEHRKKDQKKKSGDKSKRGALNAPQKKKTIEAPKDNTKITEALTKAAVAPKSTVNQFSSDSVHRPAPIAPAPAAPPRAPSSGAADGDGIDSLFSPDADLHVPLATPVAPPAPSSSSHTVTKKQKLKEAERQKDMYTELPPAPATHASPVKPLKPAAVPAVVPTSSATVTKMDTDEYGMDDEPLNEAELAALEAAEAAAVAVAAAPSTLAPSRAPVPLLLPKQLPEAPALDWMVDGPKNEEMAEEDQAQTSWPVPELPADKPLQIFWTDACDDMLNNPDHVWLFGKIWHPQRQAWASIAVKVTDMLRYVLVAPRALALDEQGRETTTPVNMNAVTAELQEIRRKLGITSGFMYKEVQREYVWDDEQIPYGRTSFLKLKYPAKFPPIPKEMLAGRTYCHVAGTQASSLETFLLKRKVRGPCWLSVRNAQWVTTRRSHSRLEAEVKFAPSYSDASNLSVAADQSSPPPPLCVLSLRLVTALTAENQQELVMFSGVVHPEVAPDEPTHRPEQKYHIFSALRKLRGPLPHDFDSAARSDPSTRSLGVQRKDSEKELLQALADLLLRWDPDVIVGHNFFGFDLDVLLHRMEKLKFAGWSKLGRLYRTKMPRLSSGNDANFFGERSVMAGRLVCDTYLSSKELIRQKTYSLTELAKSQLKITRQEVEPEQVPQYFATDAGGKRTLELVKHSINDARLCMQLMFDLQVLPLTKQLTNECGNLWSRSLTGARAERIEYLLLHEFRAKKLVLPDRERKYRLRDEEQFAAEDAPEQPKGPKKFNKTKKKAAYAGGLVLDPKRGFYDTYILLLDFQSLYPSIVQEYNVCFTTVPRSEKTAEGVLVPSEAPDPSRPKGLLPATIGRLVERRRQVKGLLKDEKDPLKKSQLNIRQQALKLVANSMYGCLGFSHSRFFAMRLAELITRKGRETLQQTVAMVRKNINLDVIYGDTDSIMINTFLHDLDRVKALGKELKEQINKTHKLLEIEIDGIFKNMLLLKKKKYAALVVGPNSELTRQTKGLDMVRRDWCDLSKDVGEYVLDQILSGLSREEVCAKIYTHLRAVAADISSNKVPISKYIITKMLTKDPADYPDAKSQPHVKVALKLRRAGRAIRAGDSVQYIICLGADGVSWAERAEPPEAVRDGAGAVRIDTQWYLTQQLHPPILRLCELIEGMDSAQIAEALGLDPARFRRAPPRNTAAAAAEEMMLVPSSKLSDEERFKDVMPLQLSCQKCGAAFSAENGILTKNFEINQLTCPACRAAVSDASICNAMTLAVRNMVRQYYEGWLDCEDPSCESHTRQLHVRKMPRCVTCGGPARRRYTDKQMHVQLLYYVWLFDVNRLKAAENETGKKPPPLAAALQKRYETLHAHATAALAQNAYNFVDLSFLLLKIDVKKQL